MPEFLPCPPCHVRLSNGTPAQMNLKDGTVEVQYPAYGQRAEGHPRAIGSNINYFDDNLRRLGTVDMVVTRRALGGFSEHPRCDPEGCESGASVGGCASSNTPGADRARSYQHVCSTGASHDLDRTQQGGYRNRRGTDGIRNPASEWSPDAGSVTKSIPTRGVGLGVGQQRSEEV